MEFFIRTIGNMAGIWVAAWMLAGIDFRQGETWYYTVLYLFIVALILTAVNWLIRPIIRVLAFPLYILTLGLFSLVTNGLVLMAAGWVSGVVRVPLIVDGWGPAIWGGTIIAIIASIVSGLLGGFVSRSDS